MRRIRGIKFSRKGFNEVLLWVLLFFGLFDTARNYTQLPIAFGYLKDIAVYLLFFLNIGRIKLQKSLGIGFYLWFLVVLLGTPLGFIFSGYSRTSILIACFKFIEFFLLTLVFSNWDKIFHVDMDKFIRKYICGSLILCFVNVFGYFVDNPIVSRTLANSNMNPDLYVGRITVGQPPVAIFPVIISLIYLMTTSEKKDLDKCLIVVFFVCIVLATSNTGILAVAISLFLIYLCGMFLVKDDRMWKKLLFFTVLVLVCFLVLFSSKNKAVVEALSFYQAKIGKYFIGSTDSMMDLRHDHWKEALTTMNPINYIFGRGAYGYISGSDAFPVENTYRITFLMYGIVGVCSMMIFLIDWFMRMCLKIRSEWHSGILGMCLLVVFTFHMYTLDIYLLYTLYFAMALFYSYLLRVENGQVAMKEDLKAISAGTGSVLEESCNV